MRRHSDADAMTSRVVREDTIAHPSKVKTIRMQTKETAIGKEEPFSKAHVIERIKHNFYLETQSFRQRIQDATEETTRAREKVHNVEEERLRLKKKCLKLQSRLQEKEATIQFLKEQQELRYPVLMDETMRNLQSIMNNQRDDMVLDVQQPLSRSIISDKVNNQETMDERIHEYEHQITQLYEEIQQEKQKNVMLNECLQEQKHAKVKLMKACKIAKREIEALKNSGMSQMLEDIEAKYRDLEKANAKLSKDLEDQRLKADRNDRERNHLVQRLEELTAESTQWADIIHAKDEKIMQLHAQVRDQQLAIENIEFDFENMGRIPSRSNVHGNEDFREEQKLLVRALRLERSKVEMIEKEVVQLKAENVQLRRGQVEARMAESNTSGMLVHSGDSVKVAYGLLDQTQHLKWKLSLLHQLLKSYEETAVIDMNLLQEVGVDPPEDSSIISEDPLERIVKNIVECTSTLGDMQHLIEAAFARILGNNCALQ